MNPWLVAALALVVLAACTRYDGSWEITGTPIPEAFEREILIALDVFREQEGIAKSDWGGKVIVHAEPFPCPDGQGRCTGWGGTHKVQVVYAPDLGLGPDIGTTALEHEIGHVATFLARSATSEEAATESATRAIPEIRRRLAAEGIVQ